jgi:hypothetical protein
VQKDKQNRIFCGKWFLGKMSETAPQITPGSPLSLKRKPVPTPRSTLRKPSTHSQKLAFLNGDDVTVNLPVGRQRNLSFDTDGDSQVIQKLFCHYKLLYCPIHIFFYVHMHMYAGKCKLILSIRNYF